MNESINVFLGKVLREELEAAAERHCRPMAEIVRGALIHYLEGETEKPQMVLRQDCKSFDTLPLPKGLIATAKNSHRPRKRLARWFFPESNACVPMPKCKTALED